MRLVLWLYTLNGVRHELYKGKSEKQAMAAKWTAQEVCAAFELNATLILQKVLPFGLEGDVIAQYDLYRGYPRSQAAKRKAELKLALDH